MVVELLLLALAEVAWSATSVWCKVKKGDLRMNTQPYFMCLVGNQNKLVPFPIIFIKYGCTDPMNHVWFDYREIN